MVNVGDISTADKSRKYNIRVAIGIIIAPCTHSVINSRRADIHIRESTITIIAVNISDPGSAIGCSGE